MATIFVTAKDVNDLTPEDRKWLRVALDIPRSSTIGTLLAECQARHMTVGRMCWLIDLFKEEERQETTAPAPTPAPATARTATEVMHPLAQKLSLTSLRTLCHKIGIEPGVMGRNMLAFEVSARAEAHGWNHDTLMLLLNTRAMGQTTYHKDIIQLDMS